MDSSITIKPRPGVNPRSHALRDPITVREAVDTELDPAKTVTATTDGGAKQNTDGGAKQNTDGDAKQNNSEPHHEAAARDVVIDPQGQEVLFGAVDVRSEHADLSPNQALMRQRAYQHHPAPKDPPHEAPKEAPKETTEETIKEPTKEDASASDPHADIEA